MVNKCVVVGCSVGYAKKRKFDNVSSSSQDNNKVDVSKLPSTTVSSFHFPTDENLRSKWVKFVSREKWSPSSNSVVCIHHFEEKYIIIGKRNKLNWDLEPVPTIYPHAYIPKSSILPTTNSEHPRKQPKNRNILPDQLTKFIDSDKISNFEFLNENHAPAGFLFQKNDENVTYFKLDVEPPCPEIKEAIKIDRNLHVKIYYKSAHIPLPEWLRQGSSSNCKLTSLSSLQNLPNYIRNRAEDMGNNLLNEMKSLQYFKKKGRPPFSAEIIRFALMQRYTSRQAYELLVKELPLPSFSLLKNLTKGGIDAIKSLKLLLEEEKNERMNLYVLMYVHRFVVGFVVVVVCFIYYNAVVKPSPKYF